MIVTYRNLIRMYYINNNMSVDVIILPLRLYIWVAFLYSRKLKVTVTKLLNSRMAVRLLYDIVLI